MADELVEEPGDLVVLADAGLSIRAGFRALTPHPPAGGTCRISLVVEALDRPMYLLVGMDRGTGRPAHVHITGSLDGRPLADPAQGRAEMGGPSGAVAVEPGAPYTQVLLVNQFLQLEAARDLMAPGETRLLELDCRRPLPLAAQPADAFAVAGAPDLATRLHISLRRDDDALEAEIAALLSVVRDAQTDATSNELEDALATLVSLRLPAATAALASLTDHPNPHVRDLASRAAADLP